MKTKVLKYEMMERTKYVVLFWVGSPNHPNSSIRSTGAYNRYEGVGDGKKGHLNDLQDELDKSGYQTQIASVSSAVTILDPLVSKNPRKRNPPRSEKVEKRKRKPSQHAPFVPYSPAFDSELVEILDNLKVEYVLL